MEKSLIQVEMIYFIHFSLAELSDKLTLREIIIVKCKRRAKPEEKEKTRKAEIFPVPVVKAISRMLQPTPMPRISMKEIKSTWMVLKNLRENSSKEEDQNKKKSRLKLNKTPNSLS